jgi:hypothetical protein
MRRIVVSYIVFVFVIFILGFNLVKFPVANAALTPANPIVSGFDWGTFFNANNYNGQTSNSVHFGTYSMQAIGSDIFFALSNCRPADCGTAVIAKFDGTSISLVGSTTSEGVSDMSLSGSNLYIAGTDPHEAWSMGDFYRSDGSTLTKIRANSGLDDVIHTWGLHVDNDGVIFAATSSHDGSLDGVTNSTCALGVTCFGTVHRSNDNGSTWTKVANVGSYRLYDIIRFNGNLYAINNNSGADSFLSRSIDNGVNWTDIKTDGQMRRTHMVIHSNNLIMLGGGNTANTLFSMNTSGAFTQHNLPFQIGINNPENGYTNYNQFAVDSNNYFYAITRTGTVVRSLDLNNWSTVANIGITDLVSIAYWPSRNSLVVSSRGPSANIFEVSLTSVNEEPIPSLSPSPSPSPTLPVNTVSNPGSSNIFTTWSLNDLKGTDPKDTSPSGSVDPQGDLDTDLKDVYMKNDSQFLYLRIDNYSTQAPDFALYIYRIFFDIDQNVATGLSGSAAGTDRAIRMGSFAPFPPDDPTDEDNQFAICTSASPASCGWEDFNNSNNIQFGKTNNSVEFKIPLSQLNIDLANCASNCALNYRITSDNVGPSADDEYLGTGFLTYEFLVQDISTPLPTFTLPNTGNITTNIAIGSLITIIFATVSIALMRFYKRKIRLKKL